jgi:glycosyltransferase involved in cell wall biosynthesis
LIGGTYKGGHDLEAWMRSVMGAHPNIRWHGAVSDDELVAAYKRASFTTYPSLVEGFGLPILESISLSKICVTHDQSVMGELAKRGGCVSVDMLSVDALAQVFVRLSTDRPFWIQKSNEAATRSLRTWKDYARDVLNILLEHQSKLSRQL